MSLLFYSTCSFIKSPIFYSFSLIICKNQGTFQGTFFLFLVATFPLFDGLPAICTAGVPCPYSCHIKYEPHFMWFSGHIKYEPHFMWFSGTDAAGKGSRGFLLVKNLYSSDTMSPEYKFLYFFVHSRIKSGIINGNLMYK